MPQPSTVTGLSGLASNAALLGVTPEPSLPQLVIQLVMAALQIFDVVRNERRR